MNATAIVEHVRCRRVVPRPDACFHWKRRKSNGMRADAPELGPFDTTGSLLVTRPSVPRTTATLALFALAVSRPTARRAYHPSRARSSITLECAVFGWPPCPRRQNRQLTRPQRMPQPCKYAGILSPNVGRPAIPRVSILETRISSDDIVQTCFLEGMSSFSRRWRTSPRASEIISVPLYFRTYNIRLTI